MVDGRKIADELAAAERDRRTLLPFTDEFPDFDLDTAYDAQWMGIQAKLDTGDRLVGAKLGLTSKAKQRVMNVDAPLYGFVTSSMLAPYGDPVEDCSGAYCGSTARSRTPRPVPR
jgi:2-oxo-3-hexenedioate decarboxylase